MGTDAAPAKKAAPQTANERAVAACLRAVATADTDTLLVALDEIDTALHDPAAGPPEFDLTHGDHRYRVMLRYDYHLFRGRAGAAYCRERLGEGMTAAGVVRRLRREFQGLPPD